MSYEVWGDGDDGPDWRDDAIENGWFAPEDLSPAFRDVLQERDRQREGEGFSVEHDDAHKNFELAKAGACYAQFATYKDKTRKDALKRLFAPGSWPWSPEWWKPKDRRRDLVRAAALIIAEIERMDRADG